jgi:predicted MPP superfamily phosphohydrolase
MKLLYFLIFLLIASAVYYGMHYFVCWRIVRGFEISKSGGRVLLFVFIAAGLTYILAQFFGRFGFSIPVGYFGSVWMGIISIALTVFIIQMVAVWVFPSQERLFTVLAIVVSLLVSGYSYANAHRQPRIKVLEIPIAELPEQLSGFSIVLLADLHLERTKTVGWLNEVVNATNALQPDVIAIAGDLADEDIRAHHGFTDALKRLKSRLGVFAVTGNHEYYPGLQNFLDVCDSLDFHVLRNQRVAIADSISIIGINDNTGRQFNDGGADLEAALDGFDSAHVGVLLSHQPLYFRQAVAIGVDLQLSAHTHAGQIPPMDLIVWLAFKYPYGLYEHDGSYIYTTCGTGTWSPPMRTFSRSEIVKFVLIPARDYRDNNAN